MLTFEKLQKAVQDSFYDQFFDRMSSKATTKTLLRNEFCNYVFPYFSNYFSLSHVITGDDGSKMLGNLSLSLELYIATGSYKSLYIRAISHTSILESVWLIFVLKCDSKDGCTQNLLAVSSSCRFCEHPMQTFEQK